MSKLKIPKELFVVKRKHSANSYRGFLHEYSPNTAAGQKKMKTQVEWAYTGLSGMQGHPDNDPVRCDNGVWTVHLYNWERDPATQRFSIKQEKVYPVPLDVYPEVWQNTPVVGFEIIESATRYSTSNKFWWVLDPRGIQFEVSTDNLEDIIKKTTIVNGVIQSPCVWYSNKKLIVVE